MRTKIAHKIYWHIISLARNSKLLREVVDYSAYVFYSVFRKNKSFIFLNKNYRYFYHPYNRTVASERVVEIPYALSLLDRYKGKEILEIGNVMSHYADIFHDVIDKYERGDGVMNLDVASCKLDKKYDLIFSISTMEHVGYSYGEKKDKKKFSKSVSNLKKYLRLGGKFVATFPVYYNEFISDLIVSNKMPFDKEYYMIRTSFWNEWEQVSKRKALTTNMYDCFYANANALYIGEFTRK